jgi:nicotinamide-nucleotide amidase
VNLELVTVGTELLLGFTLDTNGAELGRACAAAGVRVTRRTAVPDESAAIRAAVAEALDRTGLVLTTGGLGPTKDDATKRVVAELLDRPLALDPAVLATLEERMRRLGRWPMPESNRVQALVPRGATVLPNPRGTAPGLWVEDDRGRAVILLPGVPREMRGLLHEEVLPRLAQRQARAPAGETVVVRSRTVRTTGVAESQLADRVGPLEDTLAPLTLAYLPGEVGVDLRLTAWDLPAAQAERRLADGVAVLRAAVGAGCYGENDADLAAVVLDLLRARGATLAVAESCTGGMLGARLTAIPGSSRVFLGGIVAYADQVKTAQLGVPTEMLREHGAVSEAVVRAMAEGARRAFAAGAALAITGIAGPDGGTAEKPVGTVWLAAALGGETRAVRVRFLGARDEVRARAAQGALNLLRRLATGD